MPRIDPRVQDIPQTVNEAIADRSIRHALFLEGFKTREQREIAEILDDSLRRILDRLDARLARIAERGFDPGPVTTRRLQELTAIYNEMITAVEQQSYGQLRETLFELSRDEAEFQMGIIQSSVPVDLEMVAPSAQRLRSLVTSEPMDGRLLRQWFRDASAKSRRNFRTIVRRGVAEGLSFGQLVQEVRGTTFRRVEGGVVKEFQDDTAALVRSAISHVSVQAKEAVFEANSDIIKGIQWIYTLDTITCRECVEKGERQTRLGAGVYPLGEGPRPPAHLNCLVGDTLVAPAGRVSAGTERLYDGEIVVIKTSGGRELTATPNHPILTRRGWIAAGGLNVGDDVICQGFSERRFLVDHDAQDMPAPLEKVSRAFLESPGVCAAKVPTTAPDFHGDGRGSQVAIVGAHRELRHERNPAIQYHLADLSFMPPGMCPSCLSSRGRFNPFLDAAFASARRLMRSLGLAVAFSSSHSRPFETFSLAGAAPLNALLTQHPTDHVTRDSVLSRDLRFRNTVPILSRYGGSRQIDPLAAQHPDTLLPQYSRDDLLRYAELARQIIGGSSGAVFTDQIVDVIVKKARCHVYNLETSDGFYLANEIIVGNCRCTTAPVLKSAAELGLPLEEFPAGTRASMDGQVSADLTYTEWLKRQPASVQDEALGPTRGDLFRAGLDEPSAYVTRQGRERTLKEMRRMEPDVFAEAGV